MEITHTKKEDIYSVVEIMNEAKQYFKQHHIPQWQNENGYPNEKDVQWDMHKGGSWVVKENADILGYSFIDVYNDPNYAYIEGKWLNNEPYVVIHRTCVKSAYKGRNIASLFVKKAEEICKEKKIYNIRVDTHEKNIAMQHMLEKNGFVKVGTIYVEDGSPRFAYQKVL